MCLHRSRMPLITQSPLLAAFDFEFLLPHPPQPCRWCGFIDIVQLYLGLFTNMQCLCCIGDKYVGLYALMVSPLTKASANSDSSLGKSPPSMPISRPSPPVMEQPPHTPLISPTARLTKRKQSTHSFAVPPQPQQRPARLPTAPPKIRVRGPLQSDPLFGIPSQVQPESASFPIPKIPPRSRARARAQPTPSLPVPQPQSRAERDYPIASPPRAGAPARHVEASSPISRPQFSQPYNVSPPLSPSGAPQSPTLESSQPLRTFNIGLRLRWPQAGGGTDYASVSKKHWTLVVQIEDSDSYFTMDGYDNNGGFDVMTRASAHHRGTFPYYLLIEYKRYTEDFREVLKFHPMRGSKYDVCFNNCQHFVAIYTLFLEAFASYKELRSWKVVVADRLKDVRGALDFDSQYAWNRPNWLLKVSGYVFTELPFAASLPAAAALSEPAIVLSTVPASGISGWLGGTATVATTVPASSLAVAAAPIVLAAGIAAGVSYYYTVNNWKEFTRFLDPRISGFPSELEPKDASPPTSFPLGVSSSPSPRSDCPSPSLESLIGNSSSLPRSDLPSFNELSHGIPASLTRSAQSRPPRVQV